MSYLDPAQSRQELIERGVYAEEDAPALDFLTLIIEEISFTMTEWLCFNPCRQEYGELLTTNGAGNAITSNYPILELKGLKRPEDHAVDLSILRPLNRIWVGDVRKLALMEPGLQFWVVYDAGLDPLPREIQIVAMKALIFLLKSPGQDPGILTEFQLDMKSIELPEGLKKEYFSPRDMGLEGKGAGLTVIDRLAQPIVRYRRNHTTVGAGLC